jgi:murein DD-endopeptidase MepM/ murein hydrolase activator NlpD
MPGEDGLGYFDWTRLAFLLFVLTVLGGLAQLGSPSADPRPLASEPPDGATTEENPPAAVAESHEPVEATPREDAAHAAFAYHGERGHQTGASVDDAQDAGPPVFYRPASPSPTPGGRPESDPVCGDLGRFPSSRTIVFPLPKEYLYSYEDTWGALRPQGGHEGTDLMAPAGTAEYAVTDGTIVPVAGANGNGWNSLGGYAVMLEAASSVGPVKGGDLFYYAHLDRESALKIGTRVRAGQVVGYAGDTGQGPEVTRGLFPPHLHLGWYDASGARSPVASGAMNPYPLLEWIKASGGAITGGSNARYCEAPQTVAPSTGESLGPASDSPGVSPDLDTGSNDPSPAVESHQRQIDHARKIAPAKPEESAPNESSRAAPGRAAPKTHSPPGNGASGDEPPRAPGRERSDAPIPKADPEGDKTNDHPEHKPNEDRGEEKGEEAKGTPKDRGEEPENRGPEDPQSPDEQTSPDQNQRPEPESNGESSLETTTPDPGSSEDPGAEPDPETTTATPETTAAE